MIKSLRAILKSLILIFTIVLLSACTSRMPGEENPDFFIDAVQPHEDAATEYVHTFEPPKVPDNDFAVSGISYTITEVEFYSLIDIDDGEMVSVHSAYEGSILFSVFKEFDPSDVNFSETTFSRETRYIAIFDMFTSSVTMKFYIEPLNYVTSAVITDGGFAFISINLDRSLPPYTSLIVYRNWEQFSIDLGVYTPVEHGIPNLAVLCDFAILFTTNGEHNREQFGVHMLTYDRTVTKMLSFSQNESDAQFLSSSILSNGTEYIYFLALNDVGTFKIGNLTSIVAELTLDPTYERILSWTLLNDSIFLIKDTISSDGLASYIRSLVHLNFFGEEIARKQGDIFTTHVLFALESNHNNILIGVDRNSVTNIILLDNNEIIKQAMDIPRDLVSFHLIEDNRFLIHYFRSLLGGVEMPKLLQIQIY